MRRNILMGSISYTKIELFSERFFKYFISYNFYPNKYNKNIPKIGLTTFK